MDAGTRDDLTLAQAKGVLPGEIPIRQATARHCATVRVQTEVCRVFGLHQSVNGYRNPPKSGGKDGLRFLVWRALLRGAEMELLNRHADVGGKKD